MDLYKLLEEQQKVVSMSMTEQMEMLAKHRMLCYIKMAEPRVKEGLHCNMTWDEVMCWDDTPAGTVATQHCADYVNSFNTHEFATRSCLPNGTWEGAPAFNVTDGWSNYSACVTQRPTDNIGDHLSRIQTIADVGYGLSLTALIIAELIMIFSKKLHCKSNTLHINLFFAFILRAATSFIQNLTFVNSLGFEKDVIHHDSGRVTFNKNGTHWECKLLMTVFMYSLTASQMWIFVEGLYLHMLVYRTLFTERHGIRLYVFLGWGLPLLYLIPWILVRIFVDDELCWNIYKDKRYVWIIKGPIVLTVLVNAVFFISIVLVLCRRVKFHRYPKGSSQHFRKIVKFAIVLIPLFGVVYLVFAPFPTGLHDQLDIVVLYCEMFYNSIQGFILALLFCFLNEEVHNQIRRCFYRRRLTGFNTRSLFMSSMRKSTNQSRTGISRDPNMAGATNCMNGGKNEGMTELKWKSPLRHSGKPGPKETNSMRDIAYKKVVSPENDGSTYTIDAV